MAQFQHRLGILGGVLSVLGVIFIASSPTDSGQIC